MRGGVCLHKKQAELAAELGISYDDWQRISTLLKDLPPMRIGDRWVSCSVAIGRAMVARAAVHDAFTEPLRESVRNAAARAAEESARKQKGKEGGIEQTPWGKDVTDALPELEADTKRKRDAAAEKQQKAVESETQKACAQKFKRPRM